MTGPPAQCRFAAFLVVGAIGFLLQLWLFAWLTRTLGWPIVTATVTSVAAAVLHNFAWHDRWTWADRGRQRRLPRFVQYLLATGATSVAANVGFVTLYAGALQVPPLTAAVFAVGSTSIFNFLVSDRVVFRRRP